MEHGKVNTQAATPSYKLGGSGSWATGLAAEEERVLRAFTWLIATLMYRVIVHRYDKVSQVAH